MPNRLRQASCRVADGLKVVYRRLLGGGAATAVKLASMAAELTRNMTKVSASDPLFKNLSSQDHALVAPVILRLGKLLADGMWAVGLGVVSAKSPSFDPSKTQQTPDALSGHATGISRITMNGRNTIAPVEGTTWMSSTPPIPPGFATGLGVKLADGATQAFNFSEFGTVWSQNIHELAGIAPDCRIKAHMPTEYADDDDLVTTSPFYVSMFYSGLQQGKASLGCVPLDARPLAPNLAQSPKPLFGAPVLGLTRASTMAIPIDPKLLSANMDDPAETALHMGRLAQQCKEIWPPPAAASDMRALASYWQPIAKPTFDAYATTANYKSRLTCENTWAFDNPDHVAMATKVYTALADRFNQLQAAEKGGGDKLEANVFGKYRSVCLNVTLPYPKVGQPFEFTAIKNMRKAIKDVGLEALVRQPLKMAQVGARAKVASDQHVYMCARGGGFVHSHRVKL